MKKIKSILVCARDARLSEGVYDSHVFRHIRGENVILRNGDYYKSSFVIYIHE